MDSVTLDPVDLRLLHALQIDGRAAFSGIADVLGVSDRTVARRSGRLRARGSVRVAGVTGSRHTGHAEWLVHLRVLPSGAAALTRALTHRPDTAWVTVTSSGTGIVCVFRVPGEGAAPLDALGRLPQVTHADAQRLLHPVMDRRWSGRTALGDGARTGLLLLSPAAATRSAGRRRTGSRRDGRPRRTVTRPRRRSGPPTPRCGIPRSEGAGARAHRAADTGHASGMHRNPHDRSGPAGHPLRAAPAPHRVRRGTAHPYGENPAPDARPGAAAAHAPPARRS
ncbi:AsnC family protein [Streptomyces sp. NTK 937]|uniref:Lrp/AsnC family transcriptional regulator n=1 Tax=Streptomyces sp. NTK 937 TaxID=1487711 RepID=UPI0004A94A75|nr:AsnC family protein [Streptomyces sp. NTK 937]KDQ70256.1 hypothetical protein DT87_24615 [Streptomyces sp. NTK 937]